MHYKASNSSQFLPLKFQKFSRPNQATSWWAPIWRGLVVDDSARHYQAMRSAVWLYLYLVIHADRKTGRLFRRVSTIAKDMGVQPGTVRYWIKRLRKGDYVRSETTGRALEITVQKWKGLQLYRPLAGEKS